MATQAPGVVEQQAHELWRAAFFGANERLLAATDALIRRCDSALPMLPPSLLAEPLTVERWDRFVRDERLSPRRNGTPIDVLARRVRNALATPHTQKMQLIVEAWLPDEHALRWVANASQGAVFQWFNEQRALLAVSVLAAPFAPRVAGTEGQCAYECALEIVRQLLGDERAQRARTALANRTFREHARELERELSEWRAPLDESDLDNEERAASREDVAFFLAQTFDAVALGDGRTALERYSMAENWCRGAAIEPPEDANIVRRYYDVPDVEAWIANS